MTLCLGVGIFLFLSFGASFAPRAHRFMHAHAHADNTSPLLRTCNARACYGVVQCLPVKSPTIYRRNLRTIAWCPCTPPLTMETFGEKISAEACSGKEIAGLLRKMMMMMMKMMTYRCWFKKGFCIYLELL